MAIENFLSANIAKPQLSSTSTLTQTIFVQRLRSRPWTYKSKFFLSFCFFFCFSVFHSVSDFLGFQLVKALVSGSGSGIPLNQDIEPSKLRAQLSHATLRFLDWLSSATLKIFISGVSSNSDFDAVKSKFGLLIEQIEMATSNSATLRTLRLAQQCHTQNFYLWCFKSDFYAVKSKFGLLIEQIETATSK